MIDVTISPTFNPVTIVRDVAIKQFLDYIVTTQHLKTLCYVVLHKRKETMQHPYNGIKLKIFSIIMCSKLNNEDFIYQVKGKRPTI